MVFLAKSSKPSWRELLGYGSPAILPWYSKLRDESDRIFWDELLGAGFNAWYLEAFIESAKETDEQPLPPIQLHLPGFELSHGYPLNSF